MPECNFHIGQHVVCVKKVPDYENPPSPPFPVVNQIYTISGFCPIRHFEGVGVFIEEIKREKEKYWCDCLHPTLFKPAKESNIEQFRQIVKPIFERKKDEALTH